MFRRTRNLKVGSCDKGQGYAEWYLGVTSFHISSESPCKTFNAAPVRWEERFSEIAMLGYVYWFWLWALVPTSLCIKHILRAFLCCLSFGIFKVSSITSYGYVVFQLFRHRQISEHLPTACSPWQGTDPKLGLHTLDTALWASNRVFRESMCRHNYRTVGIAYQQASLL